MTPRDNLGRFTTAQHADALAAERLLEVAVRNVAEMFLLHTSLGECSGCNVGEVAHETLLHAGHAADLLLRSAS